MVNHKLFYLNGNFVIMTHINEWLSECVSQTDMNINIKTFQ